MHWCKIFILIFLLLGCSRNKQEQIRTIVISSDNAVYSANDLIADSIIYSVTIANTDSLDSWNDYRLRNVNRQKFVEDIFEQIYSGNLTAYDYHNNIPLSIDEVKDIENKPDFSRERIEEIMFEESWFYSPAANTFHKEVYSLVLAYATYTDEGVRRERLKAAFKIYLRERE